MKIAVCDRSWGKKGGNIIVNIISQYYVIKCVGNINISLEKDKLRTVVFS